MSVPQEKDDTKKPPVPDDTPKAIAARIIEQRSLLKRLRRILARPKPEPNGG